MSDMKLKIKFVEETTDQMPTTYRCKIFDKENGMLLGGVTKFDLHMSVDDVLPKATLEIINFQVEMENVEGNVEISLFGPYFKSIEEMSHEELIEALKYEAKGRYLNWLQLKKYQERE